MGMQTLTYKSLLLAFFVFNLLSFQKANAVVVNRVNGGMNVIYIDFSIPGGPVPLELVRSYNSITAMSEATGWSGAFGWGWTSPFETTLTITAERNVILRDGGTGNTIFFRPQKEDPKTHEAFFDNLKRAYFEQKRGRKVNNEELKGLQFPDKMANRLKTDANFRAELASKYNIKSNIPKGEVLVSSEYGFQTLEFKNNQWIREKDGIAQFFDKEGHLTRQVDKNNFRFEFIYSKTQRGQLAEVYDQDKAASIKLTWRQDHIAEAIDNRGHRSRYTYDANGNLTAVTDSNAQNFIFKYENKKFPHLLTRIDYVNEKSYREFRYDENGLVIFHREKDGMEISYVYGRSSSDPENSFSTKVIRKGKMGTEEELDEFYIRNRADGSKYLYKQESKSNGITTVTLFTPCCGKPSQIVKNGEVTNFKYNESGLLTEKVGSKEDLKIEYDPLWKKIAKVAQNGLVSSFEYDGRGNLTKATNSRGDKVSLKYDRIGKITEMVDQQAKTISFKYGALGKPILIAQKGLGSVKIVYDNDGKILKTESVPENSGRHPTENNAQEVVRKVMKSFQHNLDVIRPAGANNSATNP